MAITTINSLAIPAGTVVSADLTYPLTGFSSTGIDDNATSTAITIDSSQRVGIGTTSPGVALDVNGDSNTQLRLTASDSLGASIINFGDQANVAVGRIIYSHINDSFSFKTNNVNDRLVIDSSGNVGIGTNSPSRNLEVHSSTGGNAYISAKRDNATSTELLLGAENGNTLLSSVGAIPMAFYTNSTERMRIDSSGNVGIGETSPARGLHVKDAAQTIARFESTSTSRGVISILDANTTDDTSVGIGAVANDLVLYSGNLTEGIRLNSSGNVGIGTASPQFQLHLSGSAPGVVMSETGAVKYYRNRAAASALTWDILNTDYSYNSEAMRIDSSGNLLVGKTSLSDTTVGFQVEPSGRTTSTMASSTSGTSSFNLYSTGAGAYRFYVSLDGQVRATNTSILAISDASLKENVRDLDKGLDTINALQPRRFDWKNGDGNDIMGFIAQEVEEVMPELVHDYKYTDEENKKGLKMGDMVPSMVKAIQELSAQVTELKAEVAALKGA